MATPLDKKFDAIAGAETKFFESLKGVDQQLAKEILKIYSRFVTGGDLVLDAAQLAQVEESLIAAVAKTDYSLAVNAYIPNFGVIAKLNKEIHDEVNGIDINDVINENSRIKNFQNAVESQLKGTPSMLIEVADDVTGEIIKVPLRNPSLDELIDPIASIIKKDVITGVSFQAATESILSAIDAGDLGLQQWASQIARDALSQADGITQDEIRKEFDLEYVQYIGTIKGTTRPFCYDMVTNHRTIKFSDLQKQLNEFIPGGVPSTTKVTNVIFGKPRTAQKGAGMIPGTTVDNFVRLRGGYNCRHQAIPTRKGGAAVEPLEEIAPEVTDNRQQGLPFVDAKTIKEAEEYAVNAGLTEHADYKGSPVEAANVINRRLTDLKRQYKTDTLSLINNKNRKNVNASANALGIRFKKSYTKKGLKPIPGIENRQKQFQKALKEWQQHKKDFPGSFTGTASYARKNRKALKEIENSAKYFRFNASSTNKLPLEATTTHEFAHVIERHYFNRFEGFRGFSIDGPVKFQDELKGRVLFDRWKKLWESHLLPTNNDKFIISEYSTHDPGELFAETFSMYHHERSKLPKKYVDFHNDLLELIEKTQ